MFYDVSAWSFLHSFDLEYSDLILKEKTEKLDLKKPKGKIISKSKYAYLFSWDDYYTPMALYELLKNNLRLKVATQKFEIDNKKFDYGTILIPLKNQNKSIEEINKILEKITNLSGINFFGVNTSKTKGIDLGSNSFKNITIPKIGLVVGNGISSYDAGEIWHLLDTKYKIPVTKIDYFSKSIITNKTEKHSKQEIIDNAISGKLMEPKSTSHKIYCNKSKRWQPIMLLSSLFKIDVKSSQENL